MIDLRDMFRAVCAITARCDNDGGTGQGAFIAPDRVLTCWHVLQGAKDVAFTNSAGQVARLKKGGAHKRFAPADLAMAVLDRPIGTETFLLPTAVPDAVPIGHKGHLVTRFNNAGASYQVRASTIDPFRLKFSSGDANGDIESRLFNCAALTGPGYSGSPVIDNVGRIFSLVIGGPQDDLKKTNLDTSGDEFPYYFLGTPIRDMIRFARHLSNP